MVVNVDKLEQTHLRTGRQVLQYDNPYRSFFGHSPSAKSPGSPLVGPW